MLYLGAQMELWEPLLHNLCRVVHYEPIEIVSGALGFARIPPWKNMTFFCTKCHKNIPQVRGSFVHYCHRVTFPRPPELLLCNPNRQFETPQRSTSRLSVLSSLSPTKTVQNGHAVKMWSVRRASIDFAASSKLDPQLTIFVIETTIARHLYGIVRAK